jgi:RNA polymerase sigma factor (sigma-70 family)
MSSIVHRKGLEGPAIFSCAQSRYRECQDTLVRQHEGLVHVVLRRQSRGDVPYEDLLQEGRIGLWQAVLHFDPQQGAAFSTYAGVAIQRHIWRAVKRANRPQGWIQHPEFPNPVEIAEEQVWWGQVKEALEEAVARLPDRLRQVICAAYGLDGSAPCTLAAIGREYGVTREMARYWHNKALLCLRLAAFSARLRQLCGQDSRTAYARTRALNRVWMRWRRSYRRQREVRRLAAF